MIGVFDATVNSFIQAERDIDVEGVNKFKIFVSSIQPSIPSTLSTRSQKEIELRVQLAGAYRLFDIFGWSDLIYNHLTVALDTQEKYFLINPFGLLFSEITASSLVTVDLEGNIIDSGSTTFGINKAGYVIHSAIHKGREDITCVMHCHSTAGVGVACMKEGLMNMSQNSAIVGPVAYHDYEGLAVNLEERERLVTDLGPKLKVVKNLSDSCNNHHRL